MGHNGHTLGTQFYYAVFPTCSHWEHTEKAFVLPKSSVARLFTPNLGTHMCAPTFLNRFSRKTRKNHEFFENKEIQGKRFCSLSLSVICLECIFVCVRILQVLTLRTWDNSISHLLVLAEQISKCRIFPGELFQRVNGL